MMAFIEQEANEKAEEIDAKVPVNHKSRYINFNTDTRQTLHYIQHIT